jgi:hypothetical protein
MTTLNDALQTALTGVASGGTFQDFAAQGVVPPYIVWSKVSKNTNNTFQGASNLQNIRLQVDCYSKTAVGRQQLEDAVGAAIAASAFINVQLSAQYLFEPDVKLFRAQLDYSVWA